MSPTEKWTVRDLGNIHSGFRLWGGGCFGTSVEHFYHSIYNLNTFIHLQLKNHVELTIHLAVLKTINNRRRGKNCNLWNGCFPHPSLQNLRLSFNMSRYFNSSSCSKWRNLTQVSLISDWIFGWWICPGLGSLNSTIPRCELVSEDLGS